MTKQQSDVSNPSSTTTNEAVPKLQRETLVMVNDRGRLGLLVALCSLAGVAVGFGLSNMAAGFHAHHCSTRIVATQSVAPESATPTWLGVRITTHRDGGAVVRAVEANSPAMNAGLRRGDVIVAFTDGHCAKGDGAQVRNATDLVRLVRRSSPGAVATLVIERGNAKMAVSAELRRMPEQIYQQEVSRHNAGW